MKTSFRLLGASATASSVVGAAPVVSAAPIAAEVGPTRAALARSQLSQDRESRHLRAHLSVMRQDRALARTLGSPRIRERIRARARAGDPRVALNAAPNPPPAVGDMFTYRMRKTFNSFTTFDEVRFRVAYVGPKLIILEDSLAPTARTMDAQLTRMGQEFDNVMYPHLLAFGDPTVVDSALDNNGHILAFFSKRVNDYVVNGQSNALLGFVTLCDFFTRAECPSSNVAEAFYAIVPDPTTGFTVDLWERYMRGTLAHEAKHIDSYAWRYYLEANVDDLEEVWLEEATAQISSELWARDLYGRTQLGDIAWADGPRCDYAPKSATCIDPAEAIGHHFSFLYDHYEASESKSVLDDPNGAPDPVIYGSSWSFVRWVTDTYAPDEAAFLGALNRVQNDHGVPNLTSKSGKPFSELLGLWSLSSLADNYPGATIADTRIRIPSWNTRDMFAGMNASLVFGNGQPAYPRAWPLTVRQVSFGNFGLASSQVTLLRGGGFICWELSGTQASPQVLAIRAEDLGPPPPQVGFAIVRIQ